MLRNRFSTNSGNNIDFEQTQAAAITSNKLQLAASWYVAMRSSELRGKKPKAVKLFGEDLVAWRDNAGKPVLMDRYCSHMGASLAQGKVTADGCLTCPFHGWQYNSAGRCTSIPYESNVPKTAVQRTFPVIERYGYVWAWYGTPEPLFALPEFPPAEQERRNFRLLRARYVTKVPVRQVVENLFDAEHTLTLHKLPAASVQLSFQVEANEDTPIETAAWYGVIVKTSIKRYVGFTGIIAKCLGLRFNTIEIQVDGWPSGHEVSVQMDGHLRFKVLTGTTPVSETETIEQILLMVAKTGSLWQDLIYYVLFGLQTILAAKQDVPVWDNMKAGGGGVYVKSDQGVLGFRKFYQRWVDQKV